MKPILASIAALLAAATAARPSPAAALSVGPGSRALRPATAGGEQISGITYAGGNLYYAVDDEDGRLYPLAIAIDRADGSISTSNIVVGAGVALSGGDDMEGCAFDPCSGMVWVSQEPGAIIREYDPATGRAAREAPVPAVQKSHRANYGLEALAISGDGLAMWTANEEALEADGPLSSEAAGSVVRLTRFTRHSTRGRWAPDGEWAYETQPIGGAKDSRARSGVSGLCALPDGTLLVLERRCYRGALSLPCFDIRIYQADLAGATEVSRLASLDGADIAPAAKTLLWRMPGPDITPNYEGMCLGPRLDDGSCALVLVADGGVGAPKEIMTLRLYGLDIRTLEFAGADGSEPSGGPYRYVDGAFVAAALPCPDAICGAAGWSFAGGQSGEGAEATFTAGADGALLWAPLPAAGH